MSKKIYQRLDAWNIEIKKEDGDKNTMVITGQNTQKTPVEIKLKIDDWFFPQVINQMAKIARERVKTAIARMDAVKNAVNE